jgi:hypothetical protein
LASRGTHNVFQNEVDLPFPKDIIRRALVEALCRRSDTEKRRHLEIAVISLEYFLPPDEYALFRGFDETMAELLHSMREGAKFDSLQSATKISESSPKESDALRERIHQRVRQSVEKRLKQNKAMRKVFGQDT